jgi:hypothetical protein
LDADVEQGSLGRRRSCAIGDGGSLGWDWEEGTEPPRPDRAEPPRGDLEEGRDRERYRGWENQLAKKSRAVHERAHTQRWRSNAVHMQLEVARQVVSAERLTTKLTALGNGRSQDVSSGIMLSNI